MYKVDFIDTEGDSVYNNKSKFTKDDILIILNSDKIIINGKTKKILNCIPEIGLYENNASEIKNINITIEDD